MNARLAGRVGYTVFVSGDFYENTRKHIFG